MANGSAIKVISVSRATSTHVSDTSPAKATGSELEISLADLRSTVMGFAQSAIKDPKARAEYIERSQAARAELIARVTRGEITPHEAARTANAMRNQIMAAARAQLSDLGLAISTGIKAKGLALEELQEKYALRRFKKAFAALLPAERELVWMDIVHAAGGPQAKMNNRAKLFGAAGRAFLIATLAISVYNILEAEDKKRQATKEGITLGAGAVGGVGAGAAVAFIASNPAGWVVGVSMFVGAALLGVGSSEVFDYFWPEK